MSKIKICSKCVNPSTRPNVLFDNDICGVCKLHQLDLEGSINWKKRKSEIDKISEWGRKHCNNSYDCIVTVSGGKDSTRQAFFVRDELGLNPLLVSAVYPPEQLHDRGADNLSNLISHGFDCISVGLNPIISKALMKESLLRYSNIFTASEMALYAIPIHAAIAYHIPLIFLGENPAHTIGEKHGKLDGDASQMRNSNTLMGGRADVFLGVDVSQQDLHFYNYPSEEDVKAAKLRLVYLGYYIKDWSGWNNGEFSKARGLKVRTDTPENTGDLWGVSALDEEFRLVNQQIKFAKFGFGHVTDQVMERIHAGAMTREEGMDLVKKYDGKCHPKYVEKLCNYLDITTNEFWNIVEKSRNRNIWKKNKFGEWTLERK
jgi:N-acetyl sugar amidotransferase